MGRSSHRLTAALSGGGTWCEVLIRFPDHPGLRHVLGAAPPGGATALRAWREVCLPLLVSGRDVPDPAPASCPLQGNQATSSASAREATPEPGDHRLGDLFGQCLLGFDPGSLKEQAGLGCVTGNSPTLGLLPEQVNIVWMDL